MAARLKDVAALAGVSVRTVSNVVSNTATVAPATRARVVAAVEELGYRPNLAARNLRQGRTGLIGVVVPEIHSPYFGALAGHLIDAAQERGWTVLLERTGGRAELERRLLDGSEGRRVDGMIVSPWSTSPAELASLAGGLPLVVLGELEPYGSIDHVALDNVAAARSAARHLAAPGRRRIAASASSPRWGTGPPSCAPRASGRGSPRPGWPRWRRWRWPICTGRRGRGRCVSCWRSPGAPTRCSASATNSPWGPCGWPRSRGCGCRGTWR